MDFDPNSIPVSDQPRCNIIKAHAKKTWVFYNRWLLAGLQQHAAHGALLGRKPASEPVAYLLRTWLAYVKFQNTIK
jgi:hypothetical protein